ncbi:MAG: hypothetical protein ACWA5P_00420 [bacterium]
MANTVKIQQQNLRKKKPLLVNTTAEWIEFRIKKTNLDFLLRCIGLVMIIGFTLLVTLIQAQIPSEYLTPFYICAAIFGLAITFKILTHKNK